VHELRVDGVLALGDLGDLARPAPLSHLADVTDSDTSNSSVGMSQPSPSLTSFLSTLPSWASPLQSVTGWNDSTTTLQTVRARGGPSPYASELETRAGSSGES